MEKVTCGTPTNTPRGVPAMHLFDRICCIRNPSSVLALVLLFATGDYVGAQGLGAAEAEEGGAGGGGLGGSSALGGLTVGPERARRLVKPCPHPPVGDRRRAQAAISAAGRGGAAGLERNELGEQRREPVKCFLHILQQSAVRRPRLQHPGRRGRPGRRSVRFPALRHDDNHADYHHQHRGSRRFGTQRQQHGGTASVGSGTGQPADLCRY